MFRMIPMMIDKFAVINPTAWVTILIAVTLTASIDKYTNIKISKNNNTN